MSAQLLSAARMVGAGRDADERCDPGVERREQVKFCDKIFSVHMTACVTTLGAVLRGVSCSCESGSCSCVCVHVAVPCQELLQYSREAEGGQRDEG